MQKVITLELVTAYRFESGFGVMIILIQHNVSSVLYMGLCLMLSADVGDEKGYLILVWKVLFLSPKYFLPLS